MASMFAVALLAALAAYTIPTALAVEADELTFTAIKMYQVNGRNATGQWGLTMERGNKQAGSMIKLNCSTDVYGACISDVLTPVMQDAGDLVRVNYTLNPNYTSLVTYKSQTPTSLQVRLCYSAYSYFDRAWRKKNKPYPRLSQNCPRKSGKIPLNLTVPAGSTFAAANSGSYTFDFDLLDEIPTATWFAMVWVYCGDTVCAFESTELKNFVETKAEMGITSGMRAAAIILSIFGPTFFIAFYIADTLYYKKNGRGLGWA